MQKPFNYFKINLGKNFLLTKVDEVRDGVKPGLNKDDPAHDLVEVDVVVQRKLVSQTHIAEERHQVTENED